MNRRKAASGWDRYSKVIREARRATGMNQQQLADSLGLSRNTIAGWETGHSRPDLDSLPGLCKALQISFSHFFSEKESISLSEKRLLNAFRSLAGTDRQAIIWQIEALAAGRTAQRQDGASRKKTPSKPLSDQVVSVFRSSLYAAAGSGFPLDSTAGDFIWLKKDAITQRADEIVTVNGESMEPTFHHGDQVLVEHTDTLREGEIGVFTIDGEGYVKEYRRDGLHSHNSDYATMTFGEHSEVRCVGRVLGRVQDEQRLTEEEQRQMEGNL